jgi:hypothetical protein
VQEVDFVAGEDALSIFREITHDSSQLRLLIIDRANRSRYRERNFFPASVLLL